MEAEIPARVYYILGALILSNAGLLIGLLWKGVQFTWFLSKMDSRITNAQATANRAHVRIDKELIKREE